MENKSTIGLSWAPKLPPMLTDVKRSTDKEKVKLDSISKPKEELIDGLYVPPRDPKRLKKLMKKNLKDTAGKSWFDMPAPTLTPELKKDLEILKLRSFIDPKRFYKKGKETSKYFQMGTVIEPASEYYSGRLTKKDRKTSIADVADGLLAGPTPETRKRGEEIRGRIKDIRGRVKKINENNRPGGNLKWKNKGAGTWKRAKGRRGA